MSLCNNPAPTWSGVEWLEYTRGVLWLGDATPARALICRDEDARGVRPCRSCMRATY